MSQVGDATFNRNSGAAISTVLEVSVDMKQVWMFNIGLNCIMYILQDRVMSPSETALFKDSD